jgi:2'-5' RNA ligase
MGSAVLSTVGRRRIAYIGKATYLSGRERPIFGAAVRRGTTAVVVPVPDAEPVVSGWRERFDDSAAAGMPAHITVLYPFLAEEDVTGDVLARLRELCAAAPVLEVRFGRTAHFPGVLYLDPEPADGLRGLTVAVAARWPQAPPYGGAFDDVIPHLTVAHDPGGGVLDEIEADVLRALPLATRLAEAALYAFDGGRWRFRAPLPFRS